MTKEQILHRIRIKTISRGGQKYAAAELGISAQHLCDILLGKRDLGPKVLNGLGIERIVTYRTIRKEDPTA